VPIFAPKKLQSQNVTREKLRKALSYKKMKLIFMVSGCKLIPFKCEKV
jgi:hypothetical protein